jgi:oligopeptide/dipeptide ABC transporter ATP-binding protein
MSALVETRDLAKLYPARGAHASIHALNGVSLEIEDGSCLGLVGESGSGKSTLGRCISRLTDPTSGRVYFDGVDLTGLKGHRLRDMRRHVQVVFQDPYAALNPRMRIRDLLEEPLKLQTDLDRMRRLGRVADVIEMVRADSSWLDRFPHQLSGGQLQRIVIARAIVGSPRFVVLDEPTSSLDLSTRAGILDLLKELQSTLSLTYLLISHDLQSVRDFCDRVAVMYLGSIVETGTADEVYGDPRHPYTQALLSATLSVDPRESSRRHILEGEPPIPTALPTGCVFSARCPLVRQDCLEVRPALAPAQGSHRAACVRVDEGTHRLVLREPEPQGPTAPEVATPVQERVGEPPRPRALDWVVIPILERVPSSWIGQFRRLPTRPVKERHAAWPPYPTELVDDLPSELRSVVGIRRDPEAEARAAREEPLHHFFVLHADVRPWVRSRMWRSFLPSAPRYLKALRRVSQAQAEPAVSTPLAIATEELTRKVRARAEELGISAIGIAPYDDKYTFAEYAGREVGDRVIVCALEDDYEVSQTIPSVHAEREVYRTAAHLMDLGLSLAEFVRSLGYRARTQDAGGEAMTIHYGVEAGLGQLGLNGQLLTPFAGSRCRLLLITTDAPLDFDGPVDFGIPAICDACRACVERCPAGAIPARRRMHRGVEKAKLNTKRCWPVVARAEGCAICMKVCPIQRYGLPKVVEEFRRTGTVLGRGTDELEGYTWIDGRHYGPRERPALDRSFFEIPGFDASRKRPPGAAGEDVVQESKFSL